MTIFSFLAEKWDSEFPNNFAIRRILADGAVRLVADEVMTVG